MPKRNIHGHKTLLCIWWDQEGVLYYELLRPNETVTSDRYQQQLCRLSDELMQKRPCIAYNRRKVILLHDNARPHVAKSVKQTLLELEWEVLPHPAYSPDLAPSDYHLFQSMQHAFTDTHFSSYEEVQKWVDEWIASKDIAFYRHGIALLPERWEKVVENERNYFD
ncbi:transposase [Lasius niger]|uniref:Transposase n=1 Tax=Lasius niger TaxID=67767 RepID=A0A0J7KQI6_LASNI|nr:transposase [Lasius niger]